VGLKDARDEKWTEGSKVTQMKPRKNIKGNELKGEEKKVKGKQNPPFGGIRKNQKPRCLGHGALDWEGNRKRIWGVLSGRGGGRNMGKAEFQRKGEGCKNWVNKLLKDFTDRKRDPLGERGTSMGKVRKT